MTKQSPTWYIAQVNYNAERTVRDRLTDLGYEAYVATQAVTRHRPNGRKVRIEKVIIPLLVFIRCTEEQRRDIVALPYINRFMTNRASARQGSHAPLATLTQHEIDTLKYMLGQTEIPISFVDSPLQIDDNVTVTRGHLRGITGRVIATAHNKSEVVVAIGLLGAAKMTISTTDLTKTD